MVISDAQKLAFCHIPKNGGSSVRRYFLEIWPGARSHSGVHPVEALGGGVRDLTHLTVGEARDWYDERLVDQGYTVISVVRPPLPRLRSALFQYLRVVHPDERDFLSTEKSLAFLETVSLEEVFERSETDHTCIHFRRQTSFVADVPGAQRDLIALEHLSQRFPDMPHVNRAGKLPGWLRPLANPVTLGLARSLGTRTKRRIRAALTRRDDRVDQAIAAMVEDGKALATAFYAEDTALYESATRKPAVA